MKITWQSTHDGRIGFHIAELHEYDATPPIDALLLDHAPLTMNPEREGLAAYLAFGNWISGDLQLPHRLGPSTTAAIERDLRFVDIRPSPIEYYPKALERGVRTVVADFDGGVVIPSWPTISVLPSSNWSGSIRSHNSIAVGSNAFALDTAASKDYESIRSRLAVAILFSGDLSVDTLKIDTRGIERAEVERIRALLLAVGIGMTAAHISETES